jgi:hypothetical protein
LDPLQFFGHVGWTRGIVPLRGSKLAPAFEDAFLSCEESEDAAELDRTTSDNL